MKLKGLIYKIFMVLCLVGLFEARAGVNTYAEEWKTRDYKSFGDTITIKAKKQMIYKLVPDEDGLYGFKLTCDTKKLKDGRTVHTAFATVYNANKEFISCVQYESEWIFLRSGKTYYVVVKKEASCDSLNAKICIDKGPTGECNHPDVSEAYLNNEDYTNINKANIKGVTYDKETHTLKLNNYSGSDEFILNSYYDVLSDEKDWPYFPKLNIKITGTNTVEYNKDSATLFSVYWCGNINVIGNGTLNIKFNGKNKSVDDVNLFIEAKRSNVIIDGPNINIEKASGTVISTYGEWGPYGKFEIKSGSISINTFENENNDYFYSAFETGYFEMSGGSIKVNYARKNDVMPSHIYETIHVLGEMNVTGGKIIITGDEKVLEKLNPISSGAGVSDEVKKFITKGKATDDSKSDDKNKTYGAKVGSKISDGKLIYKVTKTGTIDGKVVGKVTVVGLKKKTLKKVSIKSVLTINGVKYKVTAISKKAFKKGKKLKKITIKSKSIKKIAKGAFKGLKKSCVIKVPKAKKKNYVKKIKKSGFKGIVK